MNRALKRMHPAGLLVYFLSVLLVVMWNRHPWMTVIQTVTLSTIYIYEERKIKKIGPFLLPVVLAAVTNPVFVQRGVTVLFYAGSLKITLEAVLYGVNYGLLLMNVMLLCFTMNRYLKSEHWIYLAGSAFPKLGMAVSMVFRLIPKYRKQGEEMLKARAALKKERCAARLMKVCSMETTWAFETSMDQLDSMEARGYGAGKKRTHFHLFSFEKRDVLRLTEIIILFAVNVYGWSRFYGRFFFYPMMIWRPAERKDVFFMGAMALQILLPFLWKETTYVPD